jgi:hypothetical protein
MKQMILNALILAILIVATVPARAGTFHVDGATGGGGIETGFHL